MELEHADELISNFHSTDEQAPHLAPKNTILRPSEHC